MDPPVADGLPPTRGPTRSRRIGGRGSRVRKQRTRLRLFFHLGLFVVGHPHRDGWEIGVALMGAGALLHTLAAAYLAKNQVLSTGGPYRFVRNPFYVGDFLRDLGLVLACHFCFDDLRCGGVWAFAAAYFAFMFGVVIRRRVIEREEPELARLFGSAYAAYCARVPRFWPRPTPAPAVAGAGFRLENWWRNRELPRLVAMLCLAAFTYYRWEAFHHDFAIARILDDAWEAAFVAFLPALLVASKIRAEFRGQVPALVPAVYTALAGWLVFLLANDRWDSDHATLAWVLGSALFAAGLGLRLWAARDGARVRPAAGPGWSGRAVLANPADLGAILVLGAFASFAKALWLVPASLALGLCARAVLPATRPGSSGRELLWLAPPVAFAISELWLR